jgi:hypothetical protein
MLGVAFEWCNRNNNSGIYADLSCTMHDLAIEEMLTSDDV